MATDHTITVYTATVDLSSVQRPEDVEKIMEILRDTGYPELAEDRSKITAVWHVGDPEFIADLWDLCRVVDDIQAQLRSYLENRDLGKPVARGELVSA